MKRNLYRLVFFCVFSTIVLSLSKGHAQDLADSTDLFDSIVSEAVTAVSDRDIKRQEEFDQLPDGQTLLLQPKVGRFFYEFDIYALKKNNRIYHGLSDMIDVLELAIDFDEKTKQGQGWFLREDWNISIDLESGRIVSRGQEYQVSPEDIIIEEDVLFVSEEQLSQWLDMKFETDVASQFLEIETPYPLPAVARDFRQKKIRGSRGGTSVAKLPRKKIEYDWLDLNTADVRLGTQYRRADNSDPSFLNRATIAVEGQALKHEAYTVISADDRPGERDTVAGISSVVARLSKKDEDPVLLGPLKARSYVIGDTTVTDIPLTGDSQQELGFRVSNSKLSNTDFETTDINGDALPGWDIELYRNGILVNSLIVGNDGFYEFPDVQLFGGDNLFEIFFYGPQGEIRSQTINVPVTPALLASQNNTYDVTLSATETRTYQEFQTDDVDRETPHLTARFNKYFGNTLTYVGLRNRDIEGDNKTFLGAGFTKLFQSTIFDGNFGVDDQANAAAQLTARKNIKDWNLSLTGLVQDEDYITDETTNPETFVVAANAQRSFSPSYGNRATLFASAEYNQRADGQDQTSGGLGTSYQTGRLNFSNNIFYEDTNPSTGDSLTRLDNNFAVRANLGKFFIRGGVNYDIKPESQVDRYFSQISYRPRPDFTGDLTLQHQPNRDFSEARLNLNYTNDHFRASPFLDIDSDHEVFAGVNVNFNVIDTPEEGLPIMTSDRAVGRGLVSSFVFHDKDGNMVFDGEDEVLPDVIVESLNVRRRAETNERGYSLIADLPPTRATDIVVDNLSLPDPYMISGTDGVSIFPSAGEIVELEFPIHISGEIDGTVSVRQRDGELEVIKRADVLLYPLKGSKQEAIKAEAAFDGFYVASQVPPGEYLMTVSNETAKKVRAGAPIPKIVRIGYGGDTLYGYNFELEKKEAQVPVTVNYVDVATLEGSNITGTVFTLKTAPGKRTKLLGLLGNIVQKNKADDLFDGLQEVNWTIDNASIEKRYVTSSGDLEEAYRKCSQLSRHAIPCTLEVFVPSSEAGHIHTASR